MLVASSPARCKPQGAIYFLTCRCSYPASSHGPFCCPVRACPAAVHAVACTTGVRGCKSPCSELNLATSVAAVCAACLQCRAGTVRHNLFVVSEQRLSKLCEGHCFTVCVAPHMIPIHAAPRAQRALCLQCKTLAATCSASHRHAEAAHWRGPTAPATDGAAASCSRASPKV